MSPVSRAGMGMGTNLMSSTGPSLPTEERTTDVEAWRAGIEEKREVAAARRRREEAAARAVTPAPAPASTPAPPRPGPPAVEHVLVPDGEARRLAVIEDYESGDSQTVIAARYGIHQTQVSRILRAAGVRTRPFGSAATPDPPPSAPTVAPSSPAPLSTPAPADPAPDPDQPAPEEPERSRPAARARNVDGAERSVIVAAYRAGDTAVEIAARHGRNPGTIRTALRAAGVQLRDDRATRSGGTPKLDPPDVVEQVRVLYVDEGLTQEQVADELGMSPKAVYGVMRRAGIEGRPDATGTKRTRKGKPPREPRPLATPPVVSVEDLQAVAAAAAALPPAPDRPAAATAGDPAGAVDALVPPVDEVAAALASVVDATEALVRAQTDYAALRVRRLRDLANALLSVLDPTSGDRS